MAEESIQCGATRLTGASDWSPGDPSDRGVSALHHDLRHLLNHRHRLRHQRPPPLLCHLPPHGPLGEEPLPAAAAQAAVHEGPH